MSNERPGSRGDPVRPATDSGPGEPAAGTLADLISSVRREARRRLSDLSDEEFNMAVPDLSYSPHREPATEETVARVRAYREARQRRPDLAPDEFAWLYGIVLPQLAGRTDADEIMAKVDALRPPRPRAGQVGAPLLREEDVLRLLREAIDELTAGGSTSLKRWEIAQAMGVDERTLRRYGARFPAVRNLLP